MDPLEAIILGLVQGLTEFLPVSSSAHLVIVPWLLGWESPGLTFDVALHMGTLIAVLAYFFRELLALVRGFFASIVERRFLDSEPERKLSWFIAIGTIPAALGGLFIESEIEGAFHSEDPQQQANGILIIAVVLIALALLLFAAERFATHRLDLKDLTFGKSLIIGFAQALALIPGVSRSGSTLTAGLFVNLKRDAAARYSFLLGTPVVLGAGVKKAYDVLSEGGIPAADQGAFLAGFIVAAVSGYAAIWFLLRYLRRNSTLPFVVYRVVAGLAIIGLVLAGFRQ